MALSERTQRHFVLLLAAASLACAPAPRMGEAVDIAEESAILIWDAAAKTQHFIRRATFETQSKDFGFLVPTPTVPELEEAGDDAFDLLERITAPPVMRAAAKSEPTKAPPTAAAPKVEVIAQVKVAGYDAAILKANDAGALDVWLKKNDYHSSPELLEWFKPYIAASWIITAFKIAGGEKARRVQASAVRMSFKTEQPFFPYREPATQAASAAAPRLLVVYYLGDSRPEGRVGASRAWPGRTTWSGDLRDEERASLLRTLKLPETTAPGALRLTRFTDGSSPRPGTDDLFFTRGADQSLVPDPKAMKAFHDKILERQRSERNEELALLAIVVVLAAAVAFYPRWRRSRKSRADRS